MTVTLYHDGGRNAHKATMGLALLLFELVYDHSGSIGKLVTRETEQLLAHDLARQKLLALVCQLVLRIPPGLLGQISLAEQACNILRVLG